MWKKEHLELIMSVALILCAFLLAGRGWEMALGERVTEGTDQKVVVVDAGHGGRDPGKVGVDGCLEKDLNLEIAKKVQAILEQQDIKVIMIRDTDKCLYEEQTSNKKVQDMKNRCALINETEPDCVVSIHQNSYHEEYVSGAQVFYYSSSAEGKALAEALQSELISYADPENHRQAKANDSYYLRKKTEAPIAIVECGFLSNWKEAAKLQDDGYQSRVAWAVSMGILTYLNGFVDFSVP